MRVIIYQQRTLVELFNDMGVRRWYRYLLEILFASILKMINVNNYDTILDSINRNIELEIKKIIILSFFQNWLAFN